MKNSCTIRYSYHHSQQGYWAWDCEGTAADKRDAAAPCRALSSISPLAVHRSQTRSKTQDLIYFSFPLLLHVTLVRI